MDLAPRPERTTHVFRKVPACRASKTAKAADRIAAVEGVVPTTPAPLTTIALRTEFSGTVHTEPADTAAMAHVTCHVDMHGKPTDHVLPTTLATEELMMNTAVPAAALALAAAMTTVADRKRVNGTVHTTTTEAAIAHVTSHMDVKGTATDDVLAASWIEMITPVPAEATAALQPRVAAAAVVQR